MKILKEKNDFGLTVSFVEKEKYLAFSFRGNGDLYWAIYNIKQNNNGYESFFITKENYDVYSIFKELFDDIENIKIFDEEEEVPFYIEDDSEKRAYLIERQKELEEDKIRYRLYNRSNYNSLFDSTNRTITWYSDETANEVANILKIKEQDNSFKVEFFIQEDQKDYDRDFHTNKYIPIRFRNSGSSYDPFNLVFMRMYNKLCCVEDINDNNHQMHMEEYLYNQEKKKKLIYELK